MPLAMKKIEPLKPLNLEQMEEARRQNADVENLIEVYNKFVLFLSQQCHFFSPSASFLKCFDSIR